MKYSINKHLFYKFFTLGIALLMISVVAKDIYAACSWCPPYNRDDGRVGCILKQNKPGDFADYYYNACAEATDDTNSYEPKIKVRNQSCNFAACWTKSKSLKWDGECVIWPGGYAYPPNRYCARVAIKGDHGYTDGVYLDSQGNTQNDPLYTASDGSIFKLELPKLCAYHDPSGAETFLADIIDIDPLHAPFHKTDQIHPLADLILTTIANSLPLSFAIKTFVNLTGMDSLGEGFTEALTVIIGGWYGLGEVAFEKLLEAIKNEMKMNKIVYKGLGCVNIPLAPGPERYCAFLSQPIIKPSVEGICKTQNDGTIETIESSTLANPCVVSNNMNDLIKNSIRVTYNQYLPICDASQDPYQTDACVKINFKTGTNINTPNALYTSTAKKDIIPKCSSATPTEAQKPCVVTKLARSSYRLTYAMMSGVSNTQRLTSFASDLKDCASTTSTPSAFCQKVWGVNSGDYNDLTLTFPSQETTYNTSELLVNGNLLDMYNNTKTFQASIVRTPPSTGNQQPNQICVYEGTTKTKLIGCKDRVQSPPKPSVFACGSAQSTIPCTSTYFNPKVVLQLKSGTNITQGVIEVESMYNETSPTKINLAGFDYSSFVTDDTYVKMPFITPSAKDTGTMYGTYTPSGSDPFNSSGVRNNSLSYLNGLEYYQGKYSLGGKKICLNGFNMEDCTKNIQNCVLTKLANNNIVSCATLIDYSTTKYPGLRQCTTSDTSCTDKDTLPRKGGGTAIKIRECTSGGLQSYCYQNVTSLCTVTLSPSDRVTPAYNGAGTEALADSEYFNYQTTTYDRDLYTVRNKTEVEQGLCIPVPASAKCSAIDASAGNTPANGNATWAVTDVGIEIQGTCISGYTQTTAAPVKRNCVIDFTSGSPQVKFGTLINGYSCVISQGLNPAVTDNYTSFGQGSSNTNGKFSFMPGSLLNVTDSSGTPTITQTIPIFTNFSSSQADPQWSYLAFRLDYIDPSRVIEFSLQHILNLNGAMVVTVNGNYAYSYPNTATSANITAASYTTYTDHFSQLNLNKNLKPYLKTDGSPNYIVIYYNKESYSSASSPTPELGLQFRYQIK
jgi:hypothetical protein